MTQPPFGQSGPPQPEQPYQPPQAPQPEQPYQAPQAPQVEQPYQAPQVPQAEQPYQAPQAPQVPQAEYPPQQPYQPPQPEQPYQPASPQGYPSAPTQPTQPGYPPQPGQAYGAYQQAGYPPQGGMPGGMPPTGMPPQGGYQQPWGAQMPAPEQKKPFPVIPVVIGAVVLVLVIALVLIFVVFKQDDPTPPPPTQTSQTQAETQPASESATPTEEPSPTQSATTAPAGDLGLVALNDTFTDDGVSVTATLIQAGTTWIPALPQFGDGSDPYTHMLGIEMTGDASQSPYLAQIPSGNNLRIVAADGSEIRCTDLLEAEEHAQRSAAIVAAVSGDPAAVARVNDYDTSTGSGWVVCFATEYGVEPFLASPGYTIRYERDSGTTRDGTVIPEFVHETVVTP